MPIAIGPGAAADTWAEIRTKVRQDLWRPSASAIPDDQCDRAIHSSLLELEAQARWLWLETLDGTVTTVTAADKITLGPSVRSISHLAYLSGTTGYDILDGEPLQAVRQLARGTTEGDPCAYAFSNGVIYFDRVVPAAAEFELVYTSRCPAILADAIASPPASLVLQETAVVANAAHYVALGYLKNTEEAGRQRAVYERILDRLIDEESEARSDVARGGGLVPDTDLYDMAHGFGSY